MKIKKFLISFIFLLFVSPLFVYASDINSLSQFERLNLLFELTPKEIQQKVQLFSTFSDEHSEISIPNVIGFGMPELEGRKILIGLEEEPTAEQINFLLYFVGISLEDAIIGKLTEEIEIAPYYLEIPLTAEGFYINFLENSREYIDIDFFTVTGGIVQMGQMINIPGVGNLTLGHPNNASGTGFFTAPHGLASDGARVNIGQNGTNQIGSITRTGNGAPTGADFALVMTNGFGVEVSRIVPWANRNITNFRGIGHAGESVRSIRGLSGVHSNTIEQSGFSFTGTGGVQLRNMILTYPNGRSTPGDSGAALIRTNGTVETVLGVRRSNITLGGVVFGVYSSVTNYN